jgi:hypothetical protein
MKRVFLIFFLCVCTIGATETYAQLTKKEAKQFKKQAKSMDPNDFKALLDENASLKSQTSSLQGQLSSLQSRIGEKDSRISELQNELSRMESEVASAKRRMQEAQENQATARSTKSEMGVIFKVQIGAFRNKDLSKYFDNGEMFTGESTDDGIQKFTLGSFTDYWEADTFKKYLREMGVKDAWIVPFKDGVRVEMKDVLEGVL